MKSSTAFALILICVFLLPVYPPAGFAQTESPFAVRGTLPWHNFLSGPTAWNFQDYKQYLDRMAELQMNFVGFHCYTGGLERYVNYVEPLIRMEYRNVLPTAEFDTSITARWGYSPLTTDRFLYGTKRLFHKKIFGADCAVKARDKEDKYTQAQNLMRKVMDYAHSKGIKVCLGFEFGVYPPELYSIVPPESMLRSPYLPDPTHPTSNEILRAYIEDILTAYPKIDYVWFWLQELDINAGALALSEPFQKYCKENQHWFSDLNDEGMAFNGIWSLAYINQAHAILREKAPNVRMAISGWGGSRQLPPLLKGLHEAVPKEVIFSCLNPSQGWDPQREIMGKIKDREVWIIPWLEGDMRLWHPQLRVSLLAEQIALAKNQGIQGVIGIHWRTEDIRPNLEALGLMTMTPPPLSGLRLMTPEEKMNITVAFYQAWCEREYGASSAREIIPTLARWDADQLLAPRRSGVDSPEYFPYSPNWGFLSPDLGKEVRRLQENVARLRAREKNQKFAANLEYLENTLRFVLLLHETGLRLKPAYDLKYPRAQAEIPSSERSQRFREAMDEWKKAPLNELFTTYAKRVRSRGELGVLSSLNQKLGVVSQELKAFLETHQ